MPTARVIDLSHHNTIPSSLKPAREAGVWGCIHKASEGTSMVDAKLDNRAWLARDAGMLFGSYHFLRPGSITKQAAFYVNTIASILDDKHLVACDFEVDGISLAEVRTFMAEVEQLTHRSCVLYSGHSLKDALVRREDPKWLADRRLWLAQYAGKPRLPTGWHLWWLWQYSEKAEVPGITPPTDVNAYDGTVEELEEQWAGMAAAPSLEPALRPLVGITARGDVEVVVNGKIVYPEQ